MGRLLSLSLLVVGGVIVADILIHPNGVQAASQGAQGIERPALDALLGTAP